jgi:hypothetical protein
MHTSWIVSATGVNVELATLQMTHHDRRSDKWIGQRNLRHNLIQVLTTPI